MSILTTQQSVPLYNGKRATYEQTLRLQPDGFQYEIINGVLVLTPSPSFDHQNLLGALYTEIRHYLMRKQGGTALCAPMDVRFASDLVYQPDILFVSNARKNIITSQCINGAPDLIVEILSPGSRSIDLEDKREAYETHGVREYWVVDPAGLVEQSQFFRLNELAKYDTVALDAGTIASTAIDGFVLDLNAIALD